MEDDKTVTQSNIDMFCKGGDLEYIIKKCRRREDSGLSLLEERALRRAAKMITGSLLIDIARSHGRDLHGLTPDVFKILTRDADLELDIDDWCCPWCFFGFQ